MSMRWRRLSVPYTLPGCRSSFATFAKESLMGFRERAYYGLMRRSLIGFAGLLLISAQLIEAAPGDHISLSAGGLMTAGLHIYIDLETGMATKLTMPRGSLQRGEHPVWRETKKQLTRDELQRLKATIRGSLTEGLRSRACYARDEAAKKHGARPFHPPSVDSIVSLDVLLEGQFGHAPERGCESPAFNKLWDAAYSAASSRESPSSSSKRKARISSE